MYFIFQPSGDDADAVIPWEKVRIVLDHGEDEGEDQTVRDVHLAGNMFICHSSGKHALRLEYEDGCWIATSGLDVGLNKDYLLWPLSEKRLDETSSIELHFSMHFSCGKNQIQRVDANHVICLMISLIAILNLPNS